MKTAVVVDTALVVPCGAGCILNLSTRSDDELVEVITVQCVPQIEIRMQVAFVARYEV